MTPRLRRAVAGLAVVAAGTGVASVATVAGADGAEVTRGSFHTFAAGAGLGYDVGGHAQMVRTASGSTIVSIHVDGLHPGATYGSHVHAAPCATNAADGHYVFASAVGGGATSNHNEIWPGPVTADAAGVANGRTSVDAVAGATAVSVVVHDASGAKIACADLG